MPIRTITEKQWERLKEATYVTIMSNLNAVDILVEYANDPTDITRSPTYPATGLYTHAIEEFGKLFYLKQLRPKNGKVEIEYHKIFKGKKSHDFKFEIAIKELPKECIVVQVGSFTSSGFTNSGFVTDTLTDWQTRLQIFNTDINEKGDLEHPPLVSLGTLSRAVPIFRNYMTKFGYR